MPHFSRLTSRVVDFLIPFFLLLPFAWAILTPGLPNTADMPVHVIRSIEIFHAWQDGIWFPRWSANLGYGYGLPIFNYIPQLPYLITALFYALGLPIETALKGMLILSLFLASLGSYWMVRRSFGRFPAAVCAAAYLYAPIRLHVLFIQGNASQFFAWALLPWAFGGLIYFFERGKRRYGILVALSLAGTLLSHNVVSLMLGVYLSLLGLMLLCYRLIRERKVNQVPLLHASVWRRSVEALAYGLLGLALSAWVWLPALVETDFVHSGRIVANDFRRYFVPFWDLIALSPILDRSAINPYYPLTLGAIQVMLAAIAVLGGIWYGVKRQTEQVAHHRSGPHPPAPSLWYGRGGVFSSFLKFFLPSPIPKRGAGGEGRFEGVCQLFRLAVKHLKRASIDSILGPHRGPGGIAILGSSSSLLAVKMLFWAITLLTCGFMALEASKPLWETLPLVHFFQFPARWHGLTVLALSWFVALAIYLAGRTHLMLQRVAGSIALLLLIGSSLVNLYPHRLPANMYEVSPEEVVSFEVRTQIVGTMSFSEFNPIWVQEPLYDSPLVADYLANEPLQRLDLASLPPGAEATSLHSSTQAHRFGFNLPTATEMVLRLHYFPGWEATIDGEPIMIRPAPNSGLMTLALPAGEYELALRFRETPLRLAANIISIIAWVILGMIAARMGLSWWHERRRLKQVDGKKEGHLQPEDHRWVMGSVLGVISAIMILYLGLPHWFFTVSPVNQALPASMPLQVDWQDQLRLLGIDDLPTVVQAGDEISLIAYWRALPELERDYSVFLHLDDANGQTIATIDQQNPSDIATSDWPTALYLRNQLTLQVPPDADPIRYHLRVGFYDKQSKTPLPVTSSSDPFFEVGQIWVSPRQKPSLPAGVKAQFGDHIRLQSAIYDQQTGEVKLYWLANATISEEYSIFVHLRDKEGAIIGQLDGPPYNNRYRTRDWRPEQLIEDIRPLNNVLTDLAQVDQIAIGVYLPATGERLLATDATGQPLADDMLLIDASNPF